jgi:hypothetical protein
LQVASPDYRLIRKIKDERFDEDKLHLYSLLIQLGARDLQVGVVEGSRLLLFEDFVFSDTFSTEHQIKLVKDLFEGHSLLTAGFWKSVVFSLKNNKFVQVPAQLFVESSAGEYLKFNAHVDHESDLVMSCANPSLESVTVYLVPRVLHQWLTGLYGNTALKFIHQSSALIEGVMREAGKADESPLYLYVDRFKLHILAAREGKLVYYNQFAIKHFADYVKYIMLVLSALGMNQQTSRIVMWGYIGKNSPHFHEFAKYIRNVTFGKRPDNLSYGYLFDELQEHHFFDFYATHLLA